LETDPSSGQDWRTYGEHGCTADVITLVQEILGGRKDLNAMTKLVRDKSVHGEISAERKSVEVVVELFSHEAALHSREQERA
jgi:hypothetical protein